MPCYEITVGETPPPPNKMGTLDLKDPGGPKFSDYRWGKWVKVRLKSLRWDFMIFF